MMRPARPSFVGERFGSLAVRVWGTLVGSCVLWACSNVTGGKSTDVTATDAMEVSGCVTGETTCSGKTLLTCGPDNTFVTTEECSTACDAALGCLQCAPHESTCEGDVARTCKPDGSGYSETLCDELQGQSCNATTGLCEGVCSPAELGRSYIGCEYYPTITANLVSNIFRFAVVLSNTTEHPANIHIEGGALSAPQTYTVPPGKLQTVELPWVPTLKACHKPPGGVYECGAPNQEPGLVKNGAYHVRSDQPVTAYQFNPLDYRLDTSNCDVNGSTEGCSVSNDASLLLPTNAMTGDYMAVSYPHQNAGSLGTWPGVLSITAVQDQTEVTVTSTAASRGGQNLPMLLPGVPSTITLDAGDVAQLLTASGDFTGSVVKANKPVQVVGGHHCTQLPHGNIACDHLEEVMFPVQTLGTQYVATTPSTIYGTPAKRVVRIVSLEDNTELTYQPPQPDLPSRIDGAGTFVETISQGDFVVTTNKKITVVQYMMSSTYNGGTGDPAMALVVPVGQYRKHYQFHAPTNYQKRFVNIVAPNGATITHKGTPISGFEPIGNTGYQVVRQELPSFFGDFEVVGDEPFGIEVYGYGSWTSFYYPGGLDLHPIQVD